MRTEFIVLRSGSVKQLFYRGFVKDADAQNLEDFEEAGFTLHLLSCDGDQRIDTDRNPQLRAHSVFGATIKSFDPQVLLEPFEKQFDLPTLLVELCDAQRRQSEVVGQENQAASSAVIIKTDPAKFVGIIFGCVKSVESDDLIAAQASAPIHRLRMQPAITHPAFAADHKPGTCSLDPLSLIHI